MHKLEGFIIWGLKLKIKKRMGCQNMKILFIHNTAMWYRIPFFKKLNELFEIKYFFTDFNIIGDVYAESYKDAIKEMEGLDYKISGSIFDLAKELLKADYDLVVGGSWDNIPELVKTMIIYAIAKLRGKKILLFREDWDWGFSTKRKLINPLVKIFSKLADAIVVPGTIHKKYYEKLTKSEKIFIMPNATHIKIKNNNIKGDFNKKIVLYVGRLVKRKGVDYLIKAFGVLDDPESSLVIVGYGDEEENLKKLVEELKIDNVFFAGKASQDEICTYYLMANVVVVPSITFKIGDPWVFVLNEAMQCGKPVIATEAVGGAYNLIRDGVNGFMVPERDVEALALSIKKILDDPDLERRMGDASRKIINDGFTYDHMVEGFNAAVRYICEE